MAKPAIGLMLGDASGIGPEICAKLLASGRAQEHARVVVVGDVRVLELGMRDAGVRFPYAVHDSLERALSCQDPVPVLDRADLDPARIVRGEVCAECGRSAGETLRYMIGLALGGGLDGICFAPLNKAALHRGGWNYPDEHRMFAALTGHTGFSGEMNVIEEFSTFRVTSHVALREAIAMITPARIEAAVRLADATLRAMGRVPPRIGVAALNPHAGEGGLFGDEEIRIIRPTVEKMRAAGIACEGPIPSDTIFLRALRGEFDGVVMMYHDQGQIATKLLGFHRGVTVTAGLETVFTTPAHGTAFDIVGQGRADPGAMEHALRLAAKLAAARRKAAADDAAA
jgi:4-hydroxythreonine-4-phosphate dehydrogenase